MIKDSINELCHRSMMAIIVKEKIDCEGAREVQRGRRLDREEEEREHPQEPLQQVRQPHQERGRAHLPHGRVSRSAPEGAGSACAYGVACGVCEYGYTVLR